MRFIILAAIIFPLFTQSVLAQATGQTGIIRGQILNEATKEPLFGANILVVGTTLGSSTDFDGNFQIDRVPVGTQSLRITAVGYSAFVKTDVVVTTSKPAEVLIPLVESLISIEAVQVTASYFQKIPDKPLSNLTQSNEEIRRLPGGLEDVVRAISILPGVAQVQAGRNDLIVRGGAPSENLFIIENLEVPNINHFGTQGASGGPLSFVNLDFVEGTSFSTGGFGAKYGDKLSSVLTLDLREGRKDGIGGKATISATQFGLNMEGPLSESGDNFIFSARRSYLDFIFRAAGFGFVPEYWDFLGKTHIHLSKSDQLVVFGIAALDDVRLFNSTADQRFSNSRVLSNAQNQFVGGVTWRHIANKGFLNVTLGQTLVEYDFLQNDSLLNPIFKNVSREGETSFRADYLANVADRTELSIGVIGKRVAFSNDIRLPFFTTSFGESISLVAANSSVGFKGAAYGQIAQSIGPVRVTAGVRLDYFDQIREKAVLAPRLSATYAVSPTANVSASLGRYYQAPSYVWLVSNPSNRNLSHVGADHFIVGFDQLVRTDTKISIEAYAKNYFDYPTSLTRPYLVLANTGAGFGGSEEGYASFGIDPLVSKGSGTARGVELLVQKKLSEVPCYGTVSVSYTESEFEALDGQTRPSAYDQRWIINLGGGYIFNEKWEVSTKFRFVTGRPYTPFGPGGVQNPAELYSMRVQPNHSLDVRVDRRWSFGSWTLVTYLDIQNIYNRKPLDVPRYNQREQKAVQESSIGILPSIGVSAEF